MRLIPGLQNSCLPVCGCVEVANLAFMPAVGGPCTAHLSAVHPQVALEAACEMHSLLKHLTQVVCVRCLSHTDWRRSLPTTYYNRSSMTFKETGGRAPMASETEPGELAQLAVEQLQVSFQQCTYMPTFSCSKWMLPLSAEYLSTRAAAGSKSFLTGRRAARRARCQPWAGSTSGIFLARRRWASWRAWCTAHHKSSRAPIPCLS